MGLTVHDAMRRAFGAAPEKPRREPKSGETVAAPVLLARARSGSSAWPELCTVAHGADRTNRPAADQELGDEERPWWRARWLQGAQVRQIRAAVRDLASTIRRSTKTRAASASSPISKARNRT